MPDSLSNIIEYFEQCYRSDNRELNIFDFLDRKIEDKFFIEGKEELVSNSLPIIPIDLEKAISILKKLEIFQKEKELVYASFFVCGSYMDNRGVLKRLCSPLFYYPASIEERDGFYYISIDSEDKRLNLPLINHLSEEDENTFFNDPLFKQLSNEYVEFGDISLLEKLFNKYFPSIDLQHIYGYPENVGLKSIKKAYSKSQNLEESTKVLYPSSALGIISKSTNTRGVLNELADLSLKRDISLPLQTLLENKRFTTAKEYRKGNLPMILSAAQEALVQSSSVNPLTLIVGPPGTGKSYTIGSIAIDHLSRGESVLISSRTDEAVDVIAEKLSSTLGVDKCVVRGGKKRTYSTPLNRYLKALLTRARPLSYLIKEFELPRKTSIESLRTQNGEFAELIDKLSRSIEELEVNFEKGVEQEIYWGMHLSENDRGLWNQIKTKFIQFRNSAQIPLWEQSSDLYKLDNQKVDLVAKHIRYQYVVQVMDVVLNHWNTLHQFHEAIKQSSDTHRIQKFNTIDFSVILKAFPIWLTNVSDVKDVLPFEKELFDVVIIDEATQCDMASCLPLIQRAKRVVIAGDPNQLRHVSFLSRHLQSLYRTKFNLLRGDSEKYNYRDNSLLDLVINSLYSGDQVATLDEHFRSVESIIDFSNRQFYDNELRIMSSRPKQTNKGLYFIKCKGTRDKSGANQLEADRLFQDLRKLIDVECDLSPERATSIGLLSPFRDQVDLLGKLLLKDFLVSEINKHRIRVGTAYSFQGEERDNMYLSFAVDKESHHASFHHINKPDVFNVAITRARNNQFIYLSITEKDLKGESILKSYISSPIQNETIHKRQDGFFDQFSEDVLETLKSWPIDGVWLAYEIAGLTVDILVKCSGHYLGIDLIGYPGEFQDTFGLERFRILNRAGIKVVPLPYSDWYFEKDKTMAMLKDFIFSQPRKS